MSQKVARIRPLSSRADLNVETFNWRTSNQSENITSSYKMTSILRGTLSGFTSVSRTRGRDIK
jgi:hypothetical protein